MKIRSFDPSNLKEIRIAIDTALRMVSEEFGIRLSMGNMRFDERHFTTRLTVTVLQGGSELKADGELPKVGDVRYNKRSMYTVTKVDPSLLKYKISVQTQNGTKWKISLEQWNSFTK